MKPILTAKEQSLPHHNMIWVEGGTFNMGSRIIHADVNEDEYPLHEVNVKDYYMGQYLVTQGLWSAVMSLDSLPCEYRGDAYPVTNMSWYHAVLFCNCFSVWAGRSPCYYDDIFTKISGLNGDGNWDLPNAIHVYFNHTANGYRLPSEAEWEFAAKGGVRNEGYKYSGSDKLKEVGWYEENSEYQIHKVGLKYPNELDIFDLSGNVWEWCEDRWHKDYEGAPNNGSAWVDRRYERVNRVLRGGSYSTDMFLCRVVSRYNFSVGHPGHDFGVRVVLSLQEDE